MRPYTSGTGNSTTCGAAIATSNGTPSGTTGASPASENGAVPHKLQGAQGCSRFNRIPGVSVGGVHHKHKSPRHLNGKQLAEIHEAKRRAAESDSEVQVFAQPASVAIEPLTSAATRTSTGLFGWVKSLFWQPAQADADRARKRAEQAQKAGYEEHVLILSQQYQTRSGKHLDEGFYKVELEEQFGVDKVHVADKPEQAYLFPRNLFGSLPQGGVVTTSVKTPHEGIRATHAAMMAYFAAHDIPVEVIPGYINFADVDLVSPDTLVVATRDDGSKLPLSPETLTALQRVFGNPSHVLRVRLDARNPACYDLDVAFHATISATTLKPVILLHEQCFVAGRKKGEIGPAELRAELVSQGFEIIDVTEEDVWNLAANSVTNPNEPGRLLMTRPVSEALQRRLLDAGVQPDFPDGNVPIGFNQPDGISIFGLHCLTLNFRMPIATQEERDGL